MLLLATDAGDVKKTTQRTDAADASDPTSKTQG